MTRTRLVCGGTVAVLVLATTVAFAGPVEDARRTYAQGDTLLAKADFNGALKAYASAARLDTANKEYRTAYMVVKRVIALRDAIDKETNAKKWEDAARALHAFYIDNKVYSEALTLDEKLHKKLNTIETATMLAGSQIAAGKDADAEKLLAGLDAAKLTPNARALQGIALAHQKKTDAAKEIAAKIELPKDADADLCLNLARLHSLLGDTKKAGEMLTRSFEQTRPSRLDVAKAAAKDNTDLAALAKAPEFKTAMATESKVKESSCSGGSDCGSCSSKSSCSSNGGESCTEKPKQ